ncbi:LysR family transcriptional regulator [Acinetobacter ursingii]|uniref:LysR family transcriptional regulator n=1 Tax=Acinetobacter ursingii TaxID=108980 RepID=UPI00124F8A1A|nr:LysR family transcriptional regulator [Acinetobacter ursingii]VTX83000.1 HTH-type transcriptional regulator BenM [Acinetobacter ursingii]
MINFRLIRHLWLFLTVAEEQHFGRAAKKLGMSQPPLTEQIKVLEHSLNLQLFERSRRGTKLTPAGRAILPAVKKLADQLENLEIAVREAAQGQIGTITIGAISASIIEVLPKFIEHAKLHFPNLTIHVKEIDTVEAIPALENGDIDLAFARLEGDLGNHIASRPLIREHLAVALPEKHPLAAHQEVSLSQLSQEQFIMFARKISPLSYDILTGMCRKQGFFPKVIHEVRSVASQIAFVGCGQGIALVPQSITRFSYPNVVILPLAEHLEFITTAMAWRSDRDNHLLESLLESLDLDHKQAVDPETPLFN